MFRQGMQQTEKVALSVVWVDIISGEDGYIMSISNTSVKVNIYMFS